MKLRGTLFAAALLLTALALFAPGQVAGQAGGQAAGHGGGQPQRKDFREVEGTSTLVYRQRDSEAWKAHGRIVGEISYPPDNFTLSFYKSSDPELAPPFYTEEHKGNISVYETVWLLPGKYRIRISAEGFNDYLIKEVEVRKGFDCIMNIKFGTHVYHIF